MATKANTAKNKAMAPAAASKDQLPLFIDLALHSGAGLENADRDSFAIPFLAIMQKGSPQVDKDSDAYVPGAEVGDLMLTTSGQLFKDEEGVDLIFCSYRRVFLRWAPKESGGGFKGEIPVEEVVHLRAQGKFVEQEGRIFADNGDQVRDTRIHYVLVIDKEGQAHPAVLSTSSTQIKKSKMLMTQIQTYTAKDANGKVFNPPSFGHLFHAETIAESNDKGSWRGWKFTRKSFLHDNALYQAAINFHETMKTDSVKVDYEKSGDAPHADDKI